MDLPGTASHSFYAFAYLPFTFSQYCIVNAITNLYQVVGPLTGTGQMFCGIGYSSEAINGSAPVGGETEQDMYSSGFTEAGTGWKGTHAIFTVDPNNPLITILNDNSGGGSGSKNGNAFVYFRLAIAGPGNFYLGPVMVKYRVREF
jgi:hypothetical protein